MDKNTCPVCGYDGLYEPPYNEKGSGSYEICPCCGFQFGYDDFPYEEMLIAGGAINWQTEAGYQHLPLSSDEAQKLFFDALLPDLEAERIGQQYFFYETPEQYTDATNVTIEIIGMPLDRNDTDRQYYLSLTVQTYSEKTISALREDYAIDPVPYGTIFPPDEYSLLADAIVFD